MAELWAQLRELETAQHFLQSEIREDVGSIKQDMSRLREDADTSTKYFLGKFAKVDADIESTQKQIDSVCEQTTAITSAMSKLVDRIETIPNEMRNVMDTWVTICWGQLRGTPETVSGQELQSRQIHEWIQRAQEMQAKIETASNAVEPAPEASKPEDRPSSPSPSTMDFNNLVQMPHSCQPNPDSGVVEEKQGEQVVDKEREELEDYQENGRQEGQEGQKEMEVKEEPVEELLDPAAKDQVPTRFSSPMDTRLDTAPPSSLFAAPAEPTHHTFAFHLIQATPGGTQETIGDDSFVNPYPRSTQNEDQHPISLALVSETQNDEQPSTSIKEAVLFEEPESSSIQETNLAVPQTNPVQESSDPVASRCSPVAPDDSAGAVSPSPIHEPVPPLVQSPSQSPNPTDIENSAHTSHLPEALSASESSLQTSTVEPGPEAQAQRSAALLNVPQARRWTRSRSLTPGTAAPMTRSRSASLAKATGESSEGSGSKKPSSKNRKG